MNGVKFTFGKINKRVNEPIISYIKLLETAKQLFTIDEAIQTISYHDQDGDKIEISNNEDFQKICEYHKSKGDTVMKLEITPKQQIADSLIDNIKISESFNFSEHDKAKADFDYDIISEITIPKFNEVGIQRNAEGESKYTETVVETNEYGTNTQAVNVVEKETQAKEDTQSKSTETVVLGKSVDNLLISRIEDIISSRLKEMEESMKKLFEKTELKVSSNENLIILKENPIVIENELKRQDPSFVSIYNDTMEYFKDEYCSLCKYQIPQNKYICLLCKDYILCSNCEKTHSEHPLLKVNIKTRGITSSQDLIQHILSKSENKDNIIIDSFKKFINKDYFITLNTEGNPTTFAVASSSKTKFKMNILNAGKIVINEPISIIAINNRNFNVTSTIVPKLNLYENKILELTFEAPEEKGLYQFEITASISGKKCKVIGIKLDVHVVDEDKLELYNADLIFKDFPQIIDLPDDKKIVMFRLLNEKITTLDIEDVFAILKKNNFDLASSIDELTRERNEDQ
jgi:hypothetical protein